VLISVNDSLLVVRISYFVRGILDSRFHGNDRGGLFIDYTYTYGTGGTSGINFQFIIVLAFAGMTILFLRNTLVFCACFL